MNRPWAVFTDHIALTVRLTPNGGRDAIDGVETDGDGKPHLKVKVTAVPEKGKANKALVALMAKSLSVPKSLVSLASGETSRKKILRIDGDPEDLIRKLKDLIEC
ncbi:DUF167 domain-containing protein [Rhizobium mesoamericanum]|uniref:UPF0235 protein BN77_0578 n=1 Tax=Rhizobium mesoamericanum STM3625 TaxID=1211777 RepID=K0PMD8_9HYPH|nr:DUF167 domain-containing protein [Rhizobium mesoamericanum]CCM77621.1 conserved hypothetical protein [Rhizobium mesoamericanum STM3625]